MSERVYVSVDTVFDPTGYMMPRSITWKDGRTFKIDAVKDFRSADLIRKGMPGDCYTVMIRGKERYLFFEKSNSMFATRVGRWFVESGTP